MRRTKHLLGTRGVVLLFTGCSASPEMMSPDDSPSIVLVDGGGQGLGGSEAPDGADFRSCWRDDDCVPAVCCHASACLAKAEAPACGDVFCAMYCAPYSVDCGGGCSCVDGKCTARLTDSRGVAP